MSNKKIRGIAIHRPIIYGNTARLMSPEEAGATGHTHRWTVAVRSAASPDPTEAQLSGQEPADIGGGDDLSYFIKKVSFKLHETYPQSLRNVDRPPFEVTETGWGEFEIQIRIHFVVESGEKPLVLAHHLKLHPWPISSTVGPNNMLPAPKQLAPATTAPPANAEAGPSTNGDTVMKEETQAVDLTAQPDPPALVPSPVHSWQYDEIVFTDPAEVFLNTLVAYPPTPLPKAPRLPKPNPLIPVGYGGQIGELSLETETTEAERLEHARLETLTEIDRLQKEVWQHEKTLERFKAGATA